MTDLSSKHYHSNPISVKQLKTYQLMTTQGQCYHKLYEDVLNQIEETNAKIQAEIN